jgi:DNA-binding SARP family transcriptional activator
MRFRVLGPLEVFDGAEWHALGAAKTRALLATLLVNAGSVMSLDQLADELWGDAPPKTAANQVYGYVMRIRRLLGDPDGQLVVRRAPGYQLVVAPEDVDAQTFELQVKRGCAALRDGDPAQAATSLAAALALWRGPALIDVPATPLIEAAVARWEEQRLAALEARIDADLACGRHTSLAGEVGDLAREYPLREQFWGQLMLALYRCGRQADALAAYQQVRRVLGTELGIEPGAALCRLHEQILRTDAALDLKPAAAAVGSASTPAATPRQLPTDVAGFTGRADDLAELDALVAKQAGSRAVTIAVLIGTAGVGKTSLAVHWAHRIAAGYPDGQLYVNLHGYSTSPQVSPLEALTQFLRALGVPPDHIPVSVDEAAARFRSLVAGKRLLVVLDNAAAPEQVRPLLPGTPGCLVVVTSRDRLGGLMAGEGAHAHTLRTLRLDDAVALISRMVGAERVRAEPAAAAELALLCAHLPLALRVAAANLASRPRQRISSYVADLAEDDRIVTLEADGDSGTAVRAAFEVSYQRLSDPVRRLFRLLGAAPGAEFVVDAAAALTGATPAEARRLLDRLAGAHLVEEVDEGRYTFHDLLREFAAERARQEERSTDLDAAIGRLLDWYLRVTDAAAQLLSSRVLRLPPPPVTAGPPARFNDHVGALAWLDTHRSDLVAAIRARR